jgi:A/G-specific adenine glycosylase
MASMGCLPKFVALMYAQERKSFPFPSMSAKNIPNIRRNLIHWYDKVQRDLPWRRTRDPYAIWIAETMLQQTQVTTVVPYYERFLKAIPDVHTLDRAPLRKILTLWSGLGYYRRAENLKKSARVLVRSYAARLPDDYESLLSLPGIGDYTAGALMSIAFGKPFPALDGNARRVLARIFDLTREKELRDVANRLVPASRPGYFNQGLMELGATICIPKAPRCLECPLVSSCAAPRVKRPFKTFGSTQRKTKTVTWLVAIVERKGKFLLRRRSAKGMLAGLWEFPGGEKARRESLYSSLGRHLHELNGVLSRRIQIGELRHTITTRNIRAPIFLFELMESAKARLSSSHWRWLTQSELRHYPVSSMTLKAAKILAAHEKSSL